MKIYYGLKGADRKALVSAISEITGEPKRYLGMPTAAYAIGNITVDVEGTVICEDESGMALIEKLAEMGFESVGDGDPHESQENSSESIETGYTDSTEVEVMGDSDNADADIEAEDILDPDNTEINDPDSTTELVIEMPREFFTDDSLERLRKIVESKASLIKKSVGASELPIIESEDKVSFPWFHTQDAEEANAYGELVSKLSIMAKEAKRVTARERDVSNEKYAFRCFLLRLGFIGAEYKRSRKILTRNLAGSAAFSTNEAAEQFAEKQKALREGSSTHDTDGVQTECA